MSSAMEIFEARLAEHARDHANQIDFLTGKSYGSDEAYWRGWQRNTLVANIIQQYYDRDGTYHSEGRGNDAWWYKEKSELTGSRNSAGFDNESIILDAETVFSEADKFSPGLARKLVQKVENLEVASTDGYGIVATGVDLRGAELRDEYGGIFREAGGVPPEAASKETAPVSGAAVPGNQLTGSLARITDGLSSETQAILLQIMTLMATLLKSIGGQNVNLAQGRTQETRSPS